MTGETFPALLWALLLQDFPESLVLTLFVFSLLNLRLQDKRVLYVALLQTVTNLVRLLPIAFGIHTVVLTISLVVYTRLFTGVRLSRTFAAVLACLIIVLGIEMILYPPLLKLTGLNYETMFANPFIRAAFTLPYEMILLLLALVKNYYNHKKGLLVGFSR
ncbi:MAG: hypothetical protein AB1330_00470 [Bacillota bacterium]